MFQLLRVKLQYEFTPGYINNKVKLMLNRAPIPALGMSDYSICAAMENQYPPFSKEFLGFDMNQDLKVRFGQSGYGKNLQCVLSGGLLMDTVTFLWLPLDQMLSCPFIPSNLPYAVEHVANISCPL